VSKEALDDSAVFLIEFTFQINGEAETGDDNDFFKLGFVLVFKVFS
jgi:hypothetical protein